MDCKWGCFIIFATASLTSAFIPDINRFNGICPFRRHIKNLALWRASAFPLGAVFACSPMHSIGCARQAPLFNGAGLRNIPTRDFVFPKPKVNRIDRHTPLLGNVRRRTLVFHILAQKIFFFTKRFRRAPMLAFFEFSSGATPLAFFETPIRLVVFHLLSIAQYGGAHFPVRRTGHAAIHRVIRHFAQTGERIADVNAVQDSPPRKRHSVSPQWRRAQSSCWQVKTHTAE